MAELNVKIVTPQRAVFSGIAKELSAPGWDGEFDILPGHASYLSLLHGGVLQIVTDKGTQRFVIGRGFAEAGPGLVTILTDRCVAEEDVDKEAATRDLAELEGELGRTSAYDEALMGQLEEKLEIVRGILSL